MNTKRIWNPSTSDRRALTREAVDFYAVELSDGARYLRKVRNVSPGGLLMEDKLRYQRIGAVMELELPRADALPLRVRAEVTRITARGDIGLRTVSGPPLDGARGKAAALVEGHAAASPPRRAGRRDLR